MCSWVMSGTSVSVTSDMFVVVEKCWGIVDGLVDDSIRFDWMVDIYMYVWFNSIHAPPSVPLN